MSNLQSEPEGAFAVSTPRAPRQPTVTWRTLMFASLAAAVCGAPRAPRPSDAVGRDFVRVTSPRAKDETPACVVAADVDVPPRASTIGEIMTATRGFHQRVYVDGTVAGAAGESIWVPCGEHVVRIGSAGADRTVHVPWGDVIEVPSAPAR
jgi:hypothetical protein